MPATSKNDISKCYIVAGNFLIKPKFCKNFTPFPDQTGFGAEDVNLPRVAIKEIKLSKYHERLEHGTSLVHGK